MNDNPTDVEAMRSLSEALWAVVEEIKAIRDILDETARRYRDLAGQEIPERALHVEYVEEVE